MHATHNAQHSQHLLQYLSMEGKQRGREAHTRTANELQSDANQLHFHYERNPRALAAPLPRPSHSSHLPPLALPLCNLPKLETDEDEDDDKSMANHKMDIH